MIMLGNFIKTKPDLIPFVLVAAMIVLSGFASDIPDYQEYQMAYNRGGTSSGTEFLFDILIKCCKKVGLSYKDFRVVVAIVGFAFLFLAFRKIKKFTEINLTSLMTMYFFFPFALDVVQIRNFLAMTLMLYAFTWLFDATYKSKVIFMACMLGAIGFQSIAIVYLPFILLDKVEKNKNLKRFLLGMCFMSAILGINREYTIDLIMTIQRLIFKTDIRLFSYINNQARFGWIVAWVIHFSNCFFTYQFYRILLKENIENCNMKVAYAKKIYWVNIYLTVFLALYVINGNFFRIVRNVTALNNSSFLMLFNNKIRHKHMKLKCLYMLLILLQVVLYIIAPHFDDIVLKIFAKNLIM